MDQDQLLLVLFAGFFASLVDGALGMGFGPTSSTILLGAGLSPATASATVNLAKMATGFASAVSHWRFRNIDHGLVLRLALPGCAGAALGVTVLANIDGDDLRPALAAMLLVVGLRILWRFRRPLFTSPVEGVDDYEHDPDRMPPYDPGGVRIAAAAGGMTNGMIGAWGPVVTPFLLHKGLPPRFAIGSVNTAEVAVATVSAGSLLGTSVGDGLDAVVVVAMLVGGIAAAPVSAWAVRHVPPRAMGLAVAGLLLVTNVREVARWADVGAASWGLYGVALLLVAAAALAPRWTPTASQT